MVVDTSAIVAILLDEPEAARFSDILGGHAQALMSAVTRVELSLVIEGRYGQPGRVDLEALLGQARIEVIPVSLHHADMAIEAFRRFCRGRHPAALNIGDCFSYALAKATDQPLLFKGGDFAQTDIRAALLPPG